MRKGSFMSRAKEMCEYHRLVLRLFNYTPLFFRYYMMLGNILITVPFLADYRVQVRSILLLLLLLLLFFFFQFD